MRFEGQNVLVSGGTRGIGRGIAEAFLREGACVLVSSSSGGKPWEELQAAHPEALAAGRLHHLAFDVADFAQCEAAFAKLPFEKLDVLVNSAGIRKDSIVGAMPVADWQRVLDVNLTGTFNLSKLAVMKMSRARYGRIVNITSPCSHFGFEGQSNYAASKAGQIALARSLSKEVARRNITVNGVSPGFIGTELIADLPAELAAKYKEQVPLKRFGTVEEVASCVLFLASKEASYVTGATLEVTGGL
ncbi:MAG: hypothetical protein RL095_1409 [Verrucomicrobiota bacterium]|jgi:3-oxoacyl-[acyl-carrier protein] reductase